MSQQVGVSQQDSGFSMGGILISFFVGGLIGAGVVMLTAPKAGEETRKMIKKLAEGAKEKAEDYIDHVKDMATAYVKIGKDLVEKENDIITKTIEAGKEACEKEKQS